jgi:hypothetical protein
MSSNGVPIQEISDTVGHKSTHVTETVYRHVIVPAIQGGATVMDNVFDDEDEDSLKGGRDCPRHPSRASGSNSERMACPVPGTPQARLASATLNSACPCWLRRRPQPHMRVRSVTPTTAQRLQELSA